MFIKTLVASALMSMSTIAAADSTYPSGGVKIITPMAVGSGPDTVVRQVAKDLSIKWNQPVVVVNRPGGSGTVALMAFINEPANGLNLFLASSDNIVSYPTLYKNDSYINAMIAVAPLHRTSLMLISNSSIDSYQDLVKAINKNPIYGSWGIGSPAQLVSLQLLETLGIKNDNHLPYKDYGQWFIDVADQRVSFSFPTLGSALPMQKLGKIKFFATTASRRDPNYPDVPTMRELTGEQPVMSTTWTAFYVRRNVDPTVRSQISQDIQQVIHQPEIQSRFKTLSWDYWDMSLDEFNKHIELEQQHFKTLANQYNINIE